MVLRSRVLIIALIQGDDPSDVSEDLSLPPSPPSEDGGPVVPGIPGCADRIGFCLPASAVLLRGSVSPWRIDAMDRRCGSSALIDAADRWSGSLQVIDRADSVLPAGRSGGPNLGREARIQGFGSPLHRLPLPRRQCRHRSPGVLPAQHPGTAPIP